MWKTRKKIKNRTFIRNRRLVWSDMHRYKKRFAALVSGQHKSVFQKSFVRDTMPSRSSEHLETVDHDLWHPSSCMILFRPVQQSAHLSWSPSSPFVTFPSKLNDCHDYKTIQAQHPNRKPASELHNNLRTASEQPDIRTTLDKLHFWCFIVIYLYYNVFIMECYYMC